MFRLSLHALTTPRHLLFTHFPDHCPDLTVDFPASQLVSHGFEGTASKSHYYCLPLMSYFALLTLHQALKIRNTIRRHRGFLQRFRPSTTNTTSGAHGGIVQSRTEVDVILTDFDKDKREAIVSLPRKMLVKYTAGNDCQHQKNNKSEEEGLKETLNHTEEDARMRDVEVMFRAKCKMEGKRLHELKLVRYWQQCSKHVQAPQSAKCTL
ncbi:hypothetical protein J6590_022993 [Homalodisca vitripennis]|nr:hypothetical protein J6590_022993 [Homalodisca vitripennis]